MDPTWMEEMVSMMSDGITGETVMKRVKQESDSTHLYSPPNKITSVIFYETNVENKEEIKYETAPSSPERQFCSSTTQQVGPVQTEEVSREEEQPRRLCLVCGDIASGFHYGVASCEACKAFFKRTIQGNIEYTCPASNECEINKRRRKACQACRFRKCLRTGMLREGVRLDRVRGGRQKYRRAVDALPMSTPARPSLQDIKLVEVVCAFEPDALSAPSGAASPLHALADLYDKELVGVIGWAKQIPGFTELQLNDQMRLLQSTWAELLSLMLAYRSMHQQPSSSNGIRLKFANDLSLDEQEAKDIGAHELYQQVVQIVGRLERVSALKEECYLLKALALANSEARLDDGAALRKFRDSILTALNDAVSVLRPYNASPALQQLLLILPSLRAADYSVRRFWLNVQRAGLVPMNKLFVEMLEAYFR